MTRFELVKLIKMLVKASADEQAVKAKAFFPDWKSDKEYKAGDRVLYDDTLFKCLQDHTAQDSWNPSDAASLWAEVLIPDPEIIPDWKQPESTNPYMKGDKVKHNSKTWASDIDNNVWEPGIYGWSEIASYDEVMAKLP